MVNNGQTISLLQSNLSLLCNAKQKQETNELELLLVIRQFGKQTENMLGNKPKKRKPEKRVRKRSVWQWKVDILVEASWNQKKN